MLDLHVLLDLDDGAGLVGRLRVRESVLELALPVGVDRKFVTGAPLALGVQIQELARQLLRRAASTGR